MEESISKRGSSVWVALFLLFFSVAVASEAYSLGLGSMLKPGAGFMIFGASSLLGLLSLHLVIKGLIIGETVRARQWRGVNWLRVVAVFATIAFYTLFLDSLGYLFTTFLFLIFQFRILGIRKWVSIIGAAAFTSLLTYVVFSMWLSLNFPKGLVPWF